MRPSRLLLLLHGFALAVLFLMAFSTDSGGSGTELLVRGLWFIGWGTMLVSLVLLVSVFVRKKVEGPEVALLGVLLIIGFLESRFVISDGMMWRALFH